MTIKPLQPIQTAQVKISITCSALKPSSAHWEHQVAGLSRSWLKISCLESLPHSKQSCMVSGGCTVALSQFCLPVLRCGCRHAVYVNQRNPIFLLLAIWNSSSHISLFILISSYFFKSVFKVAKPNLAHIYDYRDLKSVSINMSKFRYSSWKQNLSHDDRNKSTCLSLLWSWVTLLCLRNTTFF